MDRTNRVWDGTSWTETTDLILLEETFRKFRNTNSLWKHIWWRSPSGTPGHILVQQKFGMDHLGQKY